jgi:hypothetical protein
LKDFYLIPQYNLQFLALDRDFFQASIRQAKIGQHFAIVGLQVHILCSRGDLLAGEQAASGSFESILIRLVDAFVAFCLLAPVS